MQVTMTVDLHVAQLIHVLAHMVNDNLERHPNYFSRRDARDLRTLSDRIRRRLDRSPRRDA